jgi:cytosine deaminase
MSQRHDVLVRGARLRGRANQLHDIAIAGGRIVDIAPRLDAQGATEIDATGRLVTESFVNTHLHMCKVWSLDMVDGATLQAYHGEGMGDAMTAISLAAKVKQKYGEEDIVRKARRAAALAALHGNLHIRALADVDSISGLAGVRALIRVRED